MKDHPRCRYSLSSQKECSSTNGNFSCETIRRVFRNCPGMRPEQVYDITTRDTGTVPKPPRGGDGSDGGIPAFGGRASQKPVSHDHQQLCFVEGLGTAAFMANGWVALPCAGVYIACWRFLARAPSPQVTSSPWNRERK